MNWITDIPAALDAIPAFVLVFFRVAGMMIFAPLLGSTRIPRRVKLLLTVILAFGMVQSVPNVQWPATYWQWAIGIAGEMVFGLAMGMILSFVFIAAQWAGDMIGQQMGMNLGESFDPSMGRQGSVISDLYFMMTLVVFLAIRGHHAMLRGVHQSFQSLPLLSIGMNKSLFDLLVGLFMACTKLAFQLAAPILVTMLVVDLSMGFISKTMPQINVMSAGISVRGLVAVVVLIMGLGLTSHVIRGALTDAMWTVFDSWRGVKI